MRALVDRWAARFQSRYGSPARGTSWATMPMLRSTSATSAFSQDEWARQRAAKPRWRGSPSASERVSSSSVLSSRSASVGGIRIAS